MRKLKRIIDGTVFDCTVVMDSLPYGNKLSCIYYDGNRWILEPLSNFVPAIPGKDY